MSLHFVRCSCSPLYSRLVKYHFHFFNIKSRCFVIMLIPSAIASPLPFLLVRPLPLRLSSLISLFIFIINADCAQFRFVFDMFRASKRTHINRAVEGRPTERGTAATEMITESVNLIASLSFNVPEKFLLDDHFGTRKPSDACVRLVCDASLVSIMNLLAAALVR